MMVIPNHEDVVSECEGCDRVIKHWKGDRYICACHPFPRIKWLCGYPCEDDTKNETHKEDPIKKPYFF